VFRLVQLWFALGADAGTNAALAAALTAVPSHKLLPLAYQMASRVSAAQAGPLVESGFQARARRGRARALVGAACQTRGCTAASSARLRRRPCCNRPWLRRTGRAGPRVVLP
jgi:hypothetical protein